MESSFGQLLAHATRGRRYCFVIMTYRARYAFYERVREIVAEETGFECIRADSIPGAGEDLRDKIHAAIANAVFVIADVTDPSPNIYYEVGYAVARGRPALILAEEGVVIPTDLMGVEMIRYSDTMEGIPRFEQALRRHLAIHAESHVSLLRAMIVPVHPSPSFILADPKKPRASSRFRSHPRERRTWGDYLGVVGVLGAFGSVYGEHVVPELLSAGHVSQMPDESPLTWDANFYLIGSPKSNAITGQFLAAIQRGRAPNWQFGPCPGEETQVDYRVQLTGDWSPGGLSSDCVQASLGDDIRQDWGLVVRGQHPRFPERMATILAGPHSLGTGAACLAATKTELIRAIGDRLAGQIDLARRDRAIWVLVRGKADADLHLYAQGVEVVDAGVYE